MVGLGLLWLLLHSGGKDREPLALVEWITFATVVVVALSGKLRFGKGSLRRWVILLLVMAGLAATLLPFSKNPQASFSPTMVWLLLAGIGLLYASIASEQRLRQLLQATLVLALFLETFWAYFVWWGGGDVAGRLQAGTFYAPNQYAGYVLLLVPIVTVLALTSSGRVMSAAWGFFAVYAYTAILLSGSRGGQVAALVGLAACVILTSRNGLRKTLVRAALLILGIAAFQAFITSAIFFHPTARPGASPPISIRGKAPAGSSLSMRAHWAQGAVKIWLAHPITGSGLGTFGDKFSRIQHPKWQWSRYAHNQYAEALAEGGTLFGAAMIALALWPITAGLKQIRRERLPATAPKIGLWAGFLSASLHLLIDHDWSYPAYSVTFIVIGLLLLTPSKGSPEASPLNHPSNQVPQP
jgi:O-antigen ligase